MTTRSFRIGAICAAAIALACSGTTANAAQITWEDLKAPERTTEAEVELTGFLLPTDYEGDNVYQFVLLPWAGACSHTAPPPSDQVVLVTPAEPIRIERTYEPVSITGRLNKGRDMTQLFILDGVARVESDYRMRRARVRPAKIAAVPPPPARSPWKFLKQ